MTSSEGQEYEQPNKGELHKQCEEEKARNKSRGTPNNGNFVEFDKKLRNYEKERHGNDIAV